jgi:hypothetical protein
VAPIFLTSVPDRGERSVSLSVFFTPEEMLLHWLVPTDGLNVVEKRGNLDLGGI